MPRYPRRPSAIPVPVVEGGTGANSAPNARASLDLEPGVDVEAYDVNLLPGMSIGECRNVGITYAANLLTVCQANGSAFADSEGNRGHICIGKVSPNFGQSIIIPVIANATITDGDGNQLGSNSFGIATGVDWGNDMPYFIYAINSADTTIYFGISRDPTKTQLGVYGVAPRAVAWKDEGGANAQSNLVVMTNKVGDGTLLNNAPCVCIGSICMKWTT